MNYKRTLQVTLFSIIFTLFAVAIISGLSVAVSNFNSNSKHSESALESKSDIEKTVPQNHTSNH